jgi:glycosyltransferase involved in cell wall biosynthesis
MHALFVHRNYPAQFGHVAEYLVRERGWRCSFVSELEPATVNGVERIRYMPRGAATQFHSFHTRGFENAVGHAQGVFDALKERRDLRPDVVVGHSGFGSTVFLRELYDCPVVNYFEYFYRSRDSDIDFRPDVRPSPEQRLRARVRNAMILLDLENCDAGYSPTEFQRGCFPAEYRPKIRVIFDGVDTATFRPIENPVRVWNGRTIDPGTRVVTFCASGLEMMRGFDKFMEAAKIVCERRSDVLFLVAGGDRACYGDDAERIGSYGSLREQILASGGYDLDRFLFLGVVPPAELAQVLSLSDVHVYLTVPFVLSWSMMDVLACGAVVVGSNTPPVVEMVRDGETGLLVDFFDTGSIAERVLGVLDDPAAYAPLRRRAIEFIRGRYSRAVVLPRIADFLEGAAAMR